MDPYGKDREFRDFQKRMNGKQDELILQEVRDHAAYWHSDMCKRLTVEKHLSEKGVSEVTAKVDQLIAQGKLVRIPKRSGDYLKEQVLVFEGGE